MHHFQRILDDFNFKQTKLPKIKLSKTIKLSMYQLKALIIFCTIVHYNKWSCNKPASAGELCHCGFLHKAQDTYHTIQ